MHHELCIMKQWNRVLFRLHAEVVEDKGVDVGIFVDDFLHRLASAVAGFAVDTDELRRVARVGSLQRSGILEGVGRHHTVVMVCGGDE